MKSGSGDDPFADDTDPDSDDSSATDADTSDTTTDAAASGPTTDADVTDSTGADVDASESPPGSADDRSPPPHDASASGDASAPDADADSVGDTSAAGQTTAADDAPDIPWVLRRSSVKADRPNVTQFFLRDETDRAERRFQSDVEDILDADVYTLDLREAAYLVAMRHPDEVAEELLDWGYEYLE